MVGFFNQCAEYFGSETRFFCNSIVAVSGVNSIMDMYRNRIGSLKELLLVSGSRSRARAQAVVEFALILPLLLLLLVGILEVGRLIFMATSVSTASREAVRYGSAWGVAGPGFQYNNCAGIREAAKRVAILVDIQDGNIIIRYDKGPGTSFYPFFCDAASGEDPDVVVNSGDRIIVTVTASYSPMVLVVPISPRTLSAQSARTIVGTIQYPVSP
jgi:Flp pilus assembly protein TadG